MDRKYYQEYYDIERNHWWFKARQYILKAIIEKHLIDTQKSNKKILNIGAATGATTQMLSAYGEVVTVEYDKYCCDFLSEKLNINAINASMTDLPFNDNQFDLVCAFDVIEHIEDDAVALKEVNRVMNNGGNFFITVPAFNFLWSNHDDVNHHIRRYTNKTLNKVMNIAGLHASYASYFNFWLFLPIAIVRLTQKIVPTKKSKNASSGSDFEKMNSWELLNKFLYRLFLSEIFFFKRKIRLPSGVSYFCIGKKGKCD